MAFFLFGVIPVSLVFKHPELIRYAILMRVDLIYGAAVYHQSLVNSRDIVIRCHYSPSRRQEKMLDSKACTQISPAFHAVSSYGMIDCKLNFVCVCVLHLVKYHFYWARAGLTSSISVTRNYKTPSVALIWCEKHSLACTSACKQLSQVGISIVCDPIDVCGEGKHFAQLEQSVERVAW